MMDEGTYHIRPLYEMSKISFRSRFRSGGLLVLSIVNSLQKRILICSSTLFARRIVLPEMSFCCEAF